MMLTLYDMYVENSQNVMHFAHLYVNLPFFYVQMYLFLYETYFLMKYVFQKLAKVTVNLTQAMVGVVVTGLSVCFVKEKEYRIWSYLSKEAVYTIY